MTSSKTTIVAVTVVICSSPDGRFGYVAAEFDKSITLYERLMAGQSFATPVPTR